MRRRNKKSIIRKILEGIQNLDEGTKRGILIIFLFVFGGLVFLSVFNMAGKLGFWINDILKNLLGAAGIIIPLILLVLSYLLLYPDKYEIRKSNYLGVFILVVSLAGLTHSIKSLYYSYVLEELMAVQQGGGYIGYFVVKYPIKIMGAIATALVLFALFISSFLLTFNTSLWKMKEKALLAAWPYKKIKNFIGWWRWRRKEKDFNEEEGNKNPNEEKFEDVDEEMKKFSNMEIEKADNVCDDAEEKTPAIKKVHRKIDLPLELLDNQQGKPTSGDIKNDTEVIRRTFQNFGINVEMGEVNVGPTVTQYTLKPAEGIKLSQITTLHNDLALALAAHPIRIEAPIPGKALVGIEVPNKKIAIVSLKEILQSSVFKSRPSNLMLALGKDVSGKPWMADLARMPHMLIAGSTGSGKTICINSIILSLLYQNTPETLKFIMVDPKRVELPVYNGINYLITPVITDVKKTVNALKWSICEMERRFEVLAGSRKRDIETYNREMKEVMPYIVIIIDELADLMSLAGAEVEGSIIRLAQMSRAVGIHLILATQRPSVNVITGLIKANIPARVAFSVASLTDSRTILDSAGAEKLLGRGDLLFLSAEISKPKRLQGAYINDKEIKRVVRFIKDNTDEPPEYDEDVVEKKHKSEGFSSGGDDDEDELLEEAKAIILSANKASTSLLQRRLKIGYSRAARIIDILEEQGFVGPAEGSKPREVIRE